MCGDNSNVLAKSSPCFSSFHSLHKETFAAAAFLHSMGYCEGIGYNEYL
jgi:hypothetical protein